MHLQLAAALLAAILVGCQADKPVTTHTIDKAPAQLDLNTKTAFHYGQYMLDVQKSFQVEALVLSTRRYRFGRESQISPVDFALGWQSMSDPAVLDKIDISQNNRWYRWQAESYPIPRRLIETQSANIHMVPQSNRIERELLSVEPGDKVILKGFLVNARSVQDDWQWNTSLTRNDTGQGACELFYVTSVEYVNDKL